MIEFKKTTDFPRGTLYNQLVDAYSFHADCQKTWNTMWKEYEDFLFDNPMMAEKYSFVTVLDGEPVGHISWDPRHSPDYVEIGHNCILTKCKGKGLGHAQLAEAEWQNITYPAFFINGENDPFGTCQQLQEKVPSGKTF